MFLNPLHRNLNRLKRSRRREIRRRENCDRFARRGLITLVGLATLAGCGHNENTAATRQVVARVNSQEITVHQLKNGFAGADGLKPTSNATPTREILDSLIDEELLVEQSKERKLDRDPEVIQASERMRRQILVRALQEKLGASLPQPTVAEVREFYDANPALFAQRRIYTFRQFNIDSAALSDSLKSKIDKTKTREAVHAALKSENVSFNELVSVRTAEQMPIDALPTVAALNRGDIIVITGAGEASVMQLMEFVEQPATLEQATPIIREYLLGTKKKTRVAELLKTLRTTAKIEYVGPFANDTQQTTQRSKADQLAQPAQTSAQSDPSALPADAQKSTPAPETSSADQREHIRKGMGTGKI